MLNFPLCLHNLTKNNGTNVSSNSTHLNNLSILFLTTIIIKVIGTV